MFTRENREPLHPATLTDHFHELTVVADLPPVRLHDLRHGAASLMLAAGVNLKVVQETLRHSSITLTSDTYTSVPGGRGSCSRRRSGARAQSYRDWRYHVVIT